MEHHIARYCPVTLADCLQFLAAAHINGIVILLRILAYEVNHPCICSQVFLLEVILVITFSVIEGDTPAQALALLPVKE